jgi:hypothetical protein
MDGLIDFLTENCCKGGGYRGFVFGPRGVASMNIEGGHLDCRAPIRWPAAT